MSKKIISVIVAIMLFASVCIPVNGAESTEEFTPALSYTKNITIIVMENNILTDSALSVFGVDVKLLDTNVVPLDGASTQHKLTVKSITSQRDGEELVTYDPENPDPFLDVFRFTETDADGNIQRVALPLNIELQIDFADNRIFGELGYEVTVSGFSTPPDLGIDLGDAVAVPTDIVQTFTVDEFPKLDAILGSDTSEKKFYTDAEKPELDGVSVDVRTSAGETGKVTYGASNAHIFTTLPDKNEKLIVGTEEIATFFYGQMISTLPVTVEHDWSKYPVSITTDKYSDNKPGYHAIVCNGCSETHSPANHVPDSDNWKSNEDQTFVANGTESTICLDCGATLTRDTNGTADYNTAFANYHFLKVLFDYINVIFRILSAVGVR